MHRTAHRSRATILRTFAVDKLLRTEPEAHGEWEVYLLRYTSRSLHIYYV